MFVDEDKKYSATTDEVLLHYDILYAYTLNNQCIQHCPNFLLYYREHFTQVWLFQKLF